MDEMMNEYKDLFIEDAIEYIQSMNQGLVELEHNPSDHKHIDTLFRVAHTLKSSCAAVGLKELSHLAHKAEDLMQKIRTGEMKVTSEIIDAFFSFCDISRLVVEDLRQDKETKIDFTASISQFTGLIERDSTQNKDSVSVQEKPSTDEPKTLVLTQEEEGLIRAEKAVSREIWKVDVVIDPRETLKWLRAELILNAAKEIGNVIALRPDKSDFLLPSFEGDFSFILAATAELNKIQKTLSIDLIQKLLVTPWKDETSEWGSDIQKNDPIQIDDQENVKGTMDAEVGQKDAMVKSVSSSTGDTIRVNVAKLDELMNLIGEFATTVSGVKLIEKIIKEENPKSKALYYVSNFSDKLASLSSDLQFSIMTTRMMPISMAFQKFPRVIRDLNKMTGKKIRLETNHGEVELDKKVIDAIGEPLVHLIRNSADHGIETPTERLAAGKPEQGTITLSANRIGNQILVTVADDGKGIDINRIRETSVKKGFYGKDEVSKISDDVILNTLFEAGFSTASEVTDLSGRGVGLDVVKNVIFSLGGSVNIRTEQGKGTEFEMMLPLTLTTTFVILTKVGNNQFAIPVNDVHESIGISPDQIQTVDGHDTVILRDEVLPLVVLNDVFGNGNPSSEPQGKRKKKKYVIVAIYRNHKVGFIVDRIIGTEEIVQKPLEKNFRSIKGLSGVSILGDGSIVLGLDIAGLIQLIKHEKKVNHDISHVVDSLRSGSSSVNVKQKNVDVEKSQRKKEVRMSKIENAAILSLFHGAFQDAASSLSQLTGRTLKIFSSNTMELLSGEDLINAYSDRIDDPYFCSLIKTKAGMVANVLLVIEEQDGLGMFDMISGSPAGTTKEVDKDVILAIGEINNILSSAFINQMANRLQREVHPSTPYNSFDMLGAVLQGAVMQEDLIDKKILIADTVFAEENKTEFHAHLFIMTDSDEFLRILGH